MNKLPNQSSVGAEPESARGFGPLWWMVGLVLAALLSRVLLRWSAKVPLCGFREITGVPCPLCGGTRTMRSMTEFDFFSAFQFNPLVFLASTLLVGWTLLRLVDRTIGTGLEPCVRRRLSKLPVAFIVFGLLLANWLYLIRFLP